MDVETLCRPARQAEACVHPSPRIEAAFARRSLRISAATWSKTYFDVPRMRSSTSSDYLTTGIAYAWHAHRDTWYSAPPCQLNWWLPIYELTRTTRWRFTRAIGASRSRTARRATTTTPGTSCIAARTSPSWSRKTRGRCRARPSRCELDPQIRLICPVGGLVLFSAAQMHSSVPNTSGVTRFSIDFRTVHLDDVVERQRRAEPRRGLHRHGHARLHARHRFDAAAGRHRRAL